MGVVQEVSDLLERIPRSAWKLSLPLIVIGSVVSLSIRVGFVRAQALNGWAEDVSRLALVSGVGILVLGVIYAAASLIPRAFASLHHKRATAKEKQALIENVRFLPPTSALLLYHATQLPSGRFPALHGSPSYERLWELGFIKEDDPSPYVIVAGPPFGGMVRLNPAIADAMAELRTALTPILRHHYPGNYDDAAHVSKMLEETLRLERVT